MLESVTCVKRVKTSRLHLASAEKRRPMLGGSAEPISLRGQPAINPSGGQIWTQPTSHLPTLPSPLPDFFLVPSLTNPEHTQLIQTSLSLPQPSCWMTHGPPHLTVGHMTCAGVEGTPGPITPQLATLISVEASCRVTEQGPVRESGWLKKREAERERGREVAVQWCVAKSVGARASTTGLTLITSPQTSEKRKWSAPQLSPHQIELL